MNNSKKIRYSVCEEIFTIKHLPRKPIYSIRDISKIFNLSTKAIRSLVSSGELIPLDHPESAKFLAQELEDYIKDSRKMRR